MTTSDPKTNDQSVRPLLSVFAVARTDGPEIPGRYCRERHVWVVDTAEGTQPIVVAAKSDIGPVTKVAQEREPDFGAVLELATKTKMQLERDDQSFEGLLELVTKTEAKPERDDR